MRTKTLLTTLLFCAFAIAAAIAQNPKKLQKKADRYYQWGHYASAIPVYKELLLLDDNIGLRTKLANCYRLTNKTQEASEEYEAIFFTAKRKIRPRIYLQYGEVLVSNGNYSRAKEILGQYLELKPEDENARKMLENLDEIKNINSYYSQVELQPFNHNSEEDDHGAVFLDDGIIFVSDRPRPAALFKEQTGTTGREFLSLYSAARTDRLEYAAPELMPRRINELNKNIGPASFTEDGSTMVFSRNGDIENKQGAYTLQLYISTRENGRWKNAKILPFCRPNYNYMHPAISPDGKTLFFVSNRTRGQGGTDIYISKKNEEGEWSKPQNLGPEVNTPAHEGFPFLNTDGKLFFCSKGHVGFGGFDIFFTEMMPDSILWAKPTNLGTPINSSQDDISFSLHNNGKYGLFTSSRDGGDDDIYVFRFLADDDLIVSGKLFGSDMPDSLMTGAIIRIVQEGGSEQDTTIMELSGDRFEVSIDKDKPYDIIISKEGYEELKKTIDPADPEQTFLKLNAVLKKKF